jgi:hypothetical protein
MSTCIKCNAKTTRVFQQRRGRFDLCKVCWDAGYRIYFSDGLGNPIDYQEGKRNIVALGTKIEAPPNVKWLAWASDLRKKGA